ncbi:MAG: prepilin peptidase, type IV [candidate division WS6 bacterium GW2011_GWF2_39_15]|uniref:Prepilin peptidase, type IV n=1 Tax=candidate division WS6 bacterium GW2011_GWF2_39_15 TaxID=1619100 RepID=A0A0G0QX62_9BACT|nr:MAG: prepilin peptidase, type IV [candidate division WS6 bacterium GW2011_GWF2_39_15]
MVLIYFALGTILASFLNALAYRYRNGSEIDNIWTTPSHCESCKKTLLWYDLIPLLSFLYTRGKCSKCGKEVFWYYPLSEALLGLSFSLFYIYEISVISYVVLLILFLFSYWDVKDKAIPKGFTDVFIILSLLYSVFSLLYSFETDKLLSFAVVVFLFLVLYLLNFRKEKIGVGDMILLSSIFLISGLKTGIATIITTISMAGLFAIYLVIIDRRNRKRYIPLVPFMTLGYVIASILVAVYSLTTIFNLI